MTSSPDTLKPDILNIEGLKVDRPHRDGVHGILQSVNLSVKQGDFVALVGESGCGKTTLSNSILGLLPEGLRISAGRVCFFGKDLAALGETGLARIRGREIGFVPQDPGTSLNPVKTIGSQLSEAFRLHHSEWNNHDSLKSRCVALLEEVGVDRPLERLKQYPHQLSGGLKQRVLIAIAFALRPKLLIADEPTSALDVTVQKQVMAVFDRLVAEYGASVIFITHDIGLAADHASRIVVMQHGRIVEDGAMEQVIRAPVEPYTRLLIDSVYADIRGRSTGNERSRQADAEPIVVVDRLAKTFLSGNLFTGRTSFSAVADVSFVIRQGTTFALVGESGSGKSTTARIVLGLEESSGGSARVGGQEVEAGKISHRDLWRRIQFVHQNPHSSLNPRLAVSEIVASPLKAHRIGNSAERLARVATLLNQVGLPSDFARRRPRELSGGQRQRVAIARALALDAKVIVFDEALSALDVVTQGQILALLRRLQNELGLSYLFISHDLSIVRNFADDVGVMQAGRLVEVGPIDEVFARPKTDYTRGLLDALPGRALCRMVATSGRAECPKDHPAGGNTLPAIGC